MHIITRNKFSKKTWQIAILTAIITAALITRIAPTAASSQLATVNFDLYAVTGATTLPDQTVNVWGYNTSNTAVTKPGGPTLIVNEGDTVEIVLHNELSEPTSLLIRGQDMIPDLTGIAPGGTKLYSFTATQPGTYLYEAGLLPNAQHQVAMGLYGVLIVRPDPTFASVNGNFDADYANTVLADGPTHYYRLGEAAGPTAFDTVTPGSDGTYGTAVALPVPGLLSNSADTAAGFDGASADSFVDTGVTSMSNSAFSVEAWANANTIGTGGHRIVAKDEAGVTGAWILWFNQGKLRFQVRDSSNTNWVIAEAPATPPAGTAFHAVGVFDGTDVILYLDGAEVARTALGTATVNTNSLPVTIGADSDITNPREHLFDGAIDEVALYDYALNPTRIQAHFNAANMSSDTTLIDSTANFTAIDYLAGGTLYNNTDGSSCIIAAVTDTTLTCAAPLTGGAANIWALGDAYTAAGNFAYNSLISNYDDEAILVLSEIDPALNNSANPATFDMRDYSPKYWLINGRVFPQTELIQTVAGHKVLLRYINAGFQPHTMSLMGLDQLLLAEDGYPLPFQRSVVAENIMIGQTRDMIVNVPAATPDGSYITLYDSNMLLHNNNDAGFGGMMTFLTTAAGPAGPDVAGPATSAVTVTPSLTDGTTSVFLTATVSDVATGNANIQAAEYYIDDTNGTPVAMSATDGAFDSPIEAVEATIPAATIAALPPGDHLIYVRGQDALGNWGSFNLVTLRLELAGSGPVTQGLTFTPNPSAGDVIVTLSGTGDDSATGNSNIVDAEFFIDAPGADGSGTQMTVNVTEPIASIDYGLTAGDLSGLSEGVHTVYVHSKDDFAWGAMAAIDLEIDLSGPDTTNVIIAPNPNNGTLPINPSLYAARLDATLTDPLNASVRSNLYQAEFFIGAIDADGTGVPMYAADGLFDSPAEDAYALISLVNINALGPGSHTIYVHGRDASGNWGPFSSTVLVIEQDAPTVSSTTAAPNPTNGVTAVTLTAQANDAGSAITLAEWFVDVDPGPGNGTAMTISGAANPWNLSAVIDITGWADGDYTLYVRVQDAAGNWSAADSVILTVSGTPPPPPPPPPTQLHFSTLAAAAIPGVAGPYDDADVYLWDMNTTSFSRVLDGSALGLPGNADIDGLAIDSATGIYYVSFDNNSGTNVPLIGLVQDEDVVLYDPDNGEWQTFFQGGDACGLNASNAQDLDAIDYVGGVLYFSTVGNQPVNGAAGPYDDADIYSWTDGGGCNRVFDASTAGLLPHADVDGLVVTGVDQFYFSFNRDGGTTVPGLGAVQDEDVVQYDAGTWSLFFDGAAQGLNTSNGQDLDAIEIP